MPVTKVGVGFVTSSSLLSGLDQPPLLHALARLGFWACTRHLMPGAASESGLIGHEHELRTGQHR